MQIRQKKANLSSAFYDEKCVVVQILPFLFIMFSTFLLLLSLPALLISVFTDGSHTQIHSSGDDTSVVPAVRVVFDLLLI